MKFLFIVAACIFVVAHGQLDKLRENFNQMLTECKEIVGASEVDIDNYIHRITPDSDAGKCLVSCVNKKIKIQDENGKINSDSAKEAARDVIKDLDEKLYSILWNIHEKCINEAVDELDECDIGASWFTCFCKGTIDAELPPILVDE